MRCILVDGSGIDGFRHLLVYILDSVKGVIRELLGRLLLRFP